jgi:hypothetical protein
MSKRGREVIAFTIGLSALAAAVLGWYARMASIRITAWGDKLNEQDALFQSVATPEEMSGLAPEPSLKRVAVEAHEPFPVTKARLHRMTSSLL